MRDKALRARAHVSKMPKSRKRGGRQKSRSRPSTAQTGAPVVMEVGGGAWGEGESGSEDGGELNPEQLEGLEAGDMQMISRMALKEKDQAQRKKRKKDLAMSLIGSEENPVEAKRRRKGRTKVADLEDDMEEGEGDGSNSWEEVRRGGRGDGEEEEREMHYLLPLKTRGGLVLQPAVPKPKDTLPGSDGGSGSSDEDSDGGEMEGEAEEQLAALSQGNSVAERLSTAALLAWRQDVLEEKKAAIADIASSLVEAPEENILCVRQLLALCSEREPRVACTVRRMAMASLAAVFRDITPSYHIRELCEAEKAVKVSKDVRKLRVFEETLLSAYQQYLTLLDDCIRVGLGERTLGGGGGGQAKRRKERRVPLDVLADNQTLSPASMQGLGEVALRCMCELLVSLPHFNFRNNLLAAVVPRLISKSLGGKVSQLCCETIERVFRDDIVGEVSLEAVRLVSKLIKSKSYNTKPAALRSFLHLQLHSVDEPVGMRGWGGGGKKKRGSGPGGAGREGEKQKSTALPGKGSQLTRKQRKRLKAERELEVDLKEAEATESSEKKSKLQTEILQLVFATYFRILKNSRHSPLLQPVLEGLAKFAHLISVDFFSDLMSVLHSLAEAGGLTNKECMLCVLTAFEILSGQGECLNIDPRQFYVQLYGALLQLDTVSSSEDVVLALECMDKMMRKRRQVSLQRVFGFVKRLTTVSLQVMPGACLAVLSTVRKCMLAYSQCEQLLDSDGACGGVFRPDVPDPEMSQAGSTLLWELTLYSRHYSPSLRGYATHLLQGAPTQGRHALHPDVAKKSAGELVSSLSLSCLPAMAAAPPPPPHPASKLARKKRNYYHGDSGIRDDVIRRVEQEAFSLAQGVHTVELTDVG